MKSYIDSHLIITIRRMIKSNRYRIILPVGSFLGLCLRLTKSVIIILILI